MMIIMIMIVIVIKWHSLYATTMSALLKDVITKGLAVDVRPR